MADSYRDRLFTNYHTTHIVHVDTSDQQKLGWFRDYVQRNYFPYLAAYNRASATVLDIGCNKGYLLAILSQFGFEHLTGIDLSPIDIEKAQTIVPPAQLLCTDAFTFLVDHRAEFDIILIKAVVEHIQKQDIIPLLENIKRALKPGGVVIVDVPNMDWFFAPHERYMDFTHEVGFTREALQQVMLNVFTHVEVVPVDNIRLDLVRSVELKKKFARLILSKLFAWADPESTDLPIWSRSIMGIGRR